MLSRLPFSLIIFGTVSAGFSFAGEQPRLIADKDVQSLVDRRVQEWQPTADEKRFDEIGWCTSIRQAEELAAKHRRPIFLFTHDGKMQVGRC